MKKLFILLYIMSFSLYAQGITVAVAANVSYAMEALTKAFNEEHPEIKVRTILGSSGKLTAQIMNGAPYGLFLSADMKYPQFLYEKSLTLNKPKVYAQGSLAYFSVQKRDLSKGVKLLLDKNIKKIALANAKTAPYGAAAKEMLLKAGVYEVLKPKFVYGESISQTLSFSITAADIGIVAWSSLFSPRLKHFKEGEHWKMIDKGLYAPIKQGIVLLKGAEGSKAYQNFYDFVFSPKAREILKAYGYFI